MEKLAEEVRKEIGYDQQYGKSKNALELKPTDGHRKIWDARAPDAPMPVEPAPPEPSQAPEQALVPHTADIPLSQLSEATKARIQRETDEMWDEFEGLTTKSGHLPNNVGPMPTTEEQTLVVHRAQ